MRKGRSMSLGEYALLAFSSLFVIVDPIAVIPAFIAMTPRDTQKQRQRMARLACFVAAGTLMGFGAAGRWIFKILGITLPAFQFAGSILLMRIALDMLYAQRSAAKQTEEELEAGAAKDDIAIAPLGVPMLAGPGAMSTVLILLNQAQGGAQIAVLFVCIAAVFVVSLFFLSIGVQSAHRLGPLGLKLITRLMGLLLAAIAVQFAFNALEQAPFLKR